MKLTSKKNDQGSVLSGDLKALSWLKCAGHETRKDLIFHTFDEHDLLIKHNFLKRVTLILHRLLCSKIR